MATISGQLTLGATGLQSYGIDMVPDEIDFYGGARPGTTETAGLLCVGHADAGNQFAFSAKDGKGQYTTSKCIRLYNSSGTVVVEASYAGMSGTNLQLNVTVANSSYPIQIVARNAA